MVRRILLPSFAIVLIFAGHASADKHPASAANIISTPGNDPDGVISSAQIGYESPGAMPNSAANVSGQDAVGGEAVVVGFSPHSCVPIWSGLPDRGGFPLSYTFSDDAGADCVSFTAPMPVTGGGAPGPTQVPIEALARAAVDEAIALAVEPELVIAPNRRGITGLRSYFWLRSRPPSVSATASVPGLSVTAEAHPVRYVWAFGEGAGRSTSHSGRAWSRRRAGNISHLYETKGTYEVSTQVIYEVRWRAGGGGWNDLGYFSNSDGRSYRVREVRAYLTNPDD